jgi:hypothetical protein
MSCGGAGPGEVAEAFQRAAGLSLPQGRRRTCPGTPVVVDAAGPRQMHLAAERPPAPTMREFLHVRKGGRRGHGRTDKRGPGRPVRVRPQACSAWVRTRSTARESHCGNPARIGIHPRRRSRPAHRHRPARPASVVPRQGLRGCGGSGRGGHEGHRPQGQRDRTPSGTTPDAEAAGRRCGADGGPAPGRGPRPRRTGSRREPWLPKRRRGPSGSWRPEAALATDGGKDEAVRLRRTSASTSGSDQRASAITSAIAAGTSRRLKLKTVHVEVVPGWRTLPSASACSTQGLAPRGDRRPRPAPR